MLCKFSSRAIIAAIAAFSVFTAASAEQLTGDGAGLPKRNSLTKVQPASHDQIKASVASNAAPQEKLKGGVSPNRSSSAKGVPAPAIEEITVTARRVKENEKKIPVAVTVVTAQKLKELAIETPLALAGKVAGLGGAAIGSINSVNFTLRGQGTAFGGQAGVIPYFAEVPNFPLSYFDLANIQVVKGPQGTLFGQTSTGGVILFEPQRPTNKFEGYVDLQKGNYDFNAFEGALNIPIVDDKLLLRVSMQRRGRTGWATGIYSNGQPPTDLNNLDENRWRVSLIWRPTDDIENYTVYAGSDISSNGQASPLLYYDPRFMNPAARNLIPSAIPSIAASYRFWTGQPAPAGSTFSQLLANAFTQQVAAGPHTSLTDYNQANEQTTQGIINQTAWDVFPRLRVKNIFGLQWATSQGAIYDQDATNLPLLDFQCQFALGTTSSRGQCAKVGGFPARTLSDEVQLQGRFFDDKLHWQVGGFYIESGTRDFVENTRPFIVFASSSGDPASAAYCASVHVASPCTSLAKTFSNSYAAFGQGTYEILDNVHFTTGYRETWSYSETDSTATEAYQVPFQGFKIAVPVYGRAPAPGSIVLPTVVDSSPQGSYNVSLDWQPNDNTLLYVATREGYKTGGINAVANPGTPQRTYGPETSQDVEIGAKTVFNVLGMPGEANVDVYHTWYDNIQEGQAIPGTAQTITANIASASINGAELEGTLYPTEWLRISGNFAVTDASYNDWSENSTCGAQYWRPQCVGLSASAPITIDHAGGRLFVGGGAPISFTPDRFPNTSKIQWAIQPAVLLRDWIGEDVTVSANIYHRGPYVDATAVANNSVTAGLQPVVLNTIYGKVSDPFTNPGYTLADLRMDWRDALGRKGLTVSAAVTNITNEVYRVTSASAFVIIGDAYSIQGEPRMFWLDMSYRF